MGPSCQLQSRRGQRQKSPLGWFETPTPPMFGLIGFDHFHHGGRPKEDPSEADMRNVG